MTQEIEKMLEEAYKEGWRDALDSQAADDMHNPGCCGFMDFDTELSEDWETSKTKAKLRKLENRPKTI